MTVVLRIVLIIGSILATWYVLKKVRQSKMKIEDSMFWVMVSLLLVLFSLIPKAADILSDLAGTYSTANFIFLFMIFILLVKVFFMSLKISQLESRLSELIQVFALDRQKEQEKIECLGMAEGMKIAEDSTKQGREAGCYETNA